MLKSPMIVYKFVYLLSMFIQVKTRVNLRAFKPESALKVCLSMNGKSTMPSPA